MPLLVFSLSLSPILFFHYFCFLQFLFLSKEARWTHSTRWKSNQIFHFIFISFMSISYLSKTFSNEAMKAKSNAMTVLLFTFNSFAVVTLQVAHENEENLVKRCFNEDEEGGEEGKEEEEENKRSPFGRIRCSENREKNKICLLFLKEKLWRKRSNKNGRSRNKGEQRRTQRKNENLEGTKTKEKWKLLQFNFITNKK